MTLRILIFVVAYNAKKTIESVVERIPKEVFQYPTEILVIDDASQDETFRIAKGVEKSSGLPLSVLKNPINQGYGGNQKIGYLYGIIHNFDLVVLLHGDGQYAPEILPELLKPLIEGKADAVFGSRMIDPGAARKGGMPLYKYIGNRILSTFQNYVLGVQFSEFHSGYRIYSIEALKKIPFQLNSNDFHFDTEIIIQLLLAKQRIVESPIPTYYGDEICHVNGIKYAYDVVKTTLLSRLHQMGLIYRPKYDVQKTDYELKLGYSSSHTMALDCVKENSKVADVGCGPYLVKELKKKSCHVVGIDKRPPIEKESFDEFHLWNFEEEGLPVDLSKRDFVLMLDVIEHLSNPYQFLGKIRQAAQQGGTQFIITTPNIAFLSIRLKLLLGQFDYAKMGIMDMDHKHFFTFKSLKKVLRDSGFVIHKVRGVPAPFIKVFGNNFFGRFLVFLNNVAIFFWKSLFSYQIFVQATHTPTIQNLLQGTLQYSEFLSVEEEKPEKKIPR